MITQYALKEHGAVLMPEETANTPQWLSLVAPTEEEYASISQQYNIPLEHLEAALDPNERPRLEHYDEVLLIIVRSPAANPDDPPFPVRTCPVALILTPRIFITVCLDAHPVKCLMKQKIRSTARRPLIHLALALLLRISTHFIDRLHHMSDGVDAIEKTLKKSMQNSELLRMLDIEKSLIYFITALKGNQSVMEKLSSNTTLALSETEKEVLDDVLIESKQATDMAEVFSQVIGSLSDAFGAIVSNNLNKVMKFLTGMTIVFMIPSIIGALYGMNVPLPWQDVPHAFYWLCGISVIVSGSIWYILSKKDWM